MKTCVGKAGVKGLRTARHRFSVHTEMPDRDTRITCIEVQSTDRFLRTAIRSLARSSGARAAGDQARDLEMLVMEAFDQFRARGAFADLAFSGDEYDSGFEHLAMFYAIVCKVKGRWSDRRPCVEMAGIEPASEELDDEPLRA